MLLGGDYTEGVKGVGIVNAMEVLEIFDVSDNLKEGLQSFRKWLDAIDPMAEIQTFKDNTASSSKERKFHLKHRTARTRWAAPDSFPSDQVMTAYMSPVVDKSEATFTWDSPNVEGLVQFCGQHIGWTVEETMRFLHPVLNSNSSGYRQTRIDSFMKYEDSIKFADIRSKRLREVLGLTDEKEPNCKAKKTRSNTKE
jgi:DNA excision repair protein ERCC-5